MQEGQQFISTVVSIVPFEILEEKPGLYPGVFKISASLNKNDKKVDQIERALTPDWLEVVPQLLHVKESIHYIEVDIDRSISVSNPSYRVANSIVEDYVSSQLGVKPESQENRGPGLFFVTGKLTLSQVIKDCANELKKAKERQDNWFRDMVTIADDDWERFHQHRTITDMQRYAAKALKLDRPWIVNLPDATISTKCPACASLLQPGVIICANCRCIINKEEYAKLQFAGVK